LVLRGDSLKGKGQSPFPAFSRQSCWRLPVTHPAGRSLPQRPPLRGVQAHSNSEEYRISSSFKCPASCGFMAEAVGTRQGSPLRCDERHRTPALDRTRLASARRARHEAGHSNKEIWFEADAFLQIPPYVGTRGEQTSCLTPAAAQQPPPPAATPATRLPPVKSGSLKPRNR